LEFSQLTIENKKSSLCPGRKNLTRLDFGEFDKKKYSGRDALSE